MSNIFNFLVFDRMNLLLQSIQMNLFKDKEYCLFAKVNVDEGELFFFYVCV